MVDIKNLVGKKIIRTGANKDGDRSWTNTPRILREVTDNHLFFEGYEGGGYASYLLG